LSIFGSAEITVKWAVGQFRPHPGLGYTENGENSHIARDAIMAQGINDDLTVDPHGALSGVAVFELTSF